jgi:Methyltransferase FkbM domain
MSIQQTTLQATEISRIAVIRDRYLHRCFFLPKDMIRTENLEISRLDFLKIDVEGMEMDVLEGGERSSV